jgi:hypothetical protein
MEDVPTGPTLESTPYATKAAAAEHIAVQASRLARLASANGFPLLAYLIDMAVLEAWREASEPGGGRRARPVDDAPSGNI